MNIFNEIKRTAKNNLILGFTMTLALLIGGMGNAFADLITIEASGDVDWWSQSELSVLGGLTMSATAVYSTDGTDTNSADYRGEYDANLMSFSMSLSGINLNGPLSDAEGSSLLVANNDPDSWCGGCDALEFYMYDSNKSPAVDLSAYGLGSFDNIVSNIGLRDTTGSMWGTDALPVDLSLADLDVAFLSAILRPELNNFNTRIIATIDQLSVSRESTSVTEPSALLLMSLGLLGLFGVSKRKSHA